MRSLITSALLGVAALGTTVAMPAKANASWLSQALHQVFGPYYNGGYGGYYAPGYYNPYNVAPNYGYGYGYAPGYSYYTPGYVAPYTPYAMPFNGAWYGNRYYGGYGGYRPYGAWYGGHYWHHGRHGHHRW